MVYLETNASPSAAGIKMNVGSLCLVRNVRLFQCWMCNQATVAVFSQLRLLSWKSFYSLRGQICLMDCAAVQLLASCLSAHIRKQHDFKQMLSFAVFHDFFCLFIDLGSGKILQFRMFPHIERAPF